MKQFKELDSFGQFILLQLNGHCAAPFSVYALATWVQCNTQTNMK